MSPRSSSRQPGAALAMIAMAGFSLAVSQAASDLLLDFNSSPEEVLKAFGDSGWRTQGGNPGTGGFLSITDAVNDQSGILVFDDVDGGQIVQGFRIRADFRVGNPSGNEGRSAEGFSISFVPESDPVVARADAGETPDGYRDTAGAHEYGTRTGVSVCFDTWAGNTLPDGPDIEGILVRVDNTTIARVPAPTRNGGCADTNSLQTGSFVADTAGSPEGLCWRPFEMELNAAGLLSVRWKGSTVLDRLPARFPAARGRLVVMGRTGAANQNSHLDNLRITTLPASQATVGVLKPFINGFEVTLDDAPGHAVKDASVVVELDEAPVTVSMSREGPTLTVRHTTSDGERFSSASSHAVRIRFQDSSGVERVELRPFEAPTYATFPAATRVNDVTLDEPGFRIRPHQVDDGQPNSLTWTEEQLRGLHGTNRIRLDLAGLASDSEGFLAWTNKPLDFRNVTGGSGSSSQDYGFDQLGFPGFDDQGLRKPNEDNAALEILGYIEFPTSGPHVLNVASDDGFRLQTAADPRDALAVTLGAFEGGRDLDLGTSFTVWVEEPGAYPFRLIWQNGSGGAGLEWTIIHSDGSRSLVGDPSDPRSPRVYRSRASKVPWIQRAYPAPHQTRVHAQPEIQITLESAETVAQESLQLSLNGQSLAITVVPDGPRLSLRARSPEILAPDSTNLIAFHYRTTSGRSLQNSWSFKVIPYSEVLPATLAGDATSATRPGFRIRTWQVAPASDPIDPSLRIPANSDYAEAILVGLAGTNTANIANFTDSGYYSEPGSVQYSQSDPQSSTEGTEALPTGTPIPGIPGKSAAPEDNIVLEALAYLNFPTPGFVLMGVRSSDGFKVSPRHVPGVVPLRILSPSSVAGPMASVPSVRGDLGGGGLFGVLPDFPIEAEIVQARGNSPSTLAEEGCGTALINAATIRGKIALIHRGSCTFLEKVRNAEEAGALAVILSNNRPDPPIVAGGDENGIRIPCLMISRSDGARLRLTTGVRARIAADPSPVYGHFEGERETGETLFGFRVDQSGVYPFRLLGYSGSGAAHFEWFSIDPSGERTLINDTSNILSIRSFQSAETPEIPALRVLRSPDGPLVLQYEGTLQSSSTATDTFQDVTKSSNDGLYWLSPTNSGAIFRARR